MTSLRSVHWRGALFGERSLASWSLRSLGFGAWMLGWIQCGGDPERACTDIIGEASDAIDAAQRHADRTCTQDSDCFIFNFAISCIQQCTSGLGAAATAAESTLESENAALAQRYCTQLARPDCKKYLGENAPSCFPGVGPSEALCLNGKCELCGGDKCLLEGEMQICTLTDRQLSDCYSLELPH